MRSKLRTFYMRNKGLTKSFLGINIVILLTFSIWGRFILHMFSDMGIEYSGLLVGGCVTILFELIVVYKDVKELSKEKEMELLSKNGYLDSYYHTIYLSLTLVFFSLLLLSFTTLLSLDNALLNFVESLLMIEAFLYYVYVKEKVRQGEVLVAENKVIKYTGEETYKEMKERMMYKK